mmetsp:Transcript_25740/g.59402  ORF Transcript_25740/g.59402 Transcript_25740/m.59402 type:complete len:206 (-) Transcript_25740:2048-2665(-)
MTGLRAIKQDRPNQAVLPGRHRPCPSRTVSPPGFSTRSPNCSSRCRRGRQSSQQRCNHTARPTLCKVHLKVTWQNVSCTRRKKCTELSSGNRWPWMSSAKRSRNESCARMRLQLGVCLTSMRFRGRVHHLPPNLRARVPRCSNSYLEPHMQPAHMGRSLTWVGACPDSSIRVLVLYPVWHSLCRCRQACPPLVLRHLSLTMATTV